MVLRPACPPQSTDPTRKTNSQAIARRVPFGVQLSLTSLDSLDSPLTGRRWDRVVGRQAGRPNPTAAATTTTTMQRGASPAHPSLPATHRGSSLRSARSPKKSALNRWFTFRCPCAVWSRMQGRSVQETQQHAALGCASPAKGCFSGLLWATFSGLLLLLRHVRARRPARSCVAWQGTPVQCCSGAHTVLEEGHMSCP